MSFLSRLTLSRAPSVAALSAVLDPAQTGEGMDAHHRLIWSAFAGDPDAARDFLWRAEGRGRFLVLSARPPAASPFFDPPEIKPFAPALAAGDRLAFVLRANATRQRQGAGRVDVVMDALHAVPPADRAARRMACAQEAAQGWLAEQGARHGFALTGLAVDDYSVVQMRGTPGRRRGQPRFGVLDMTGRLTVTDPAAFVARMQQGFGRAKAFGCGLMLVRRD